MVNDVKFDSYNAMSHKYLSYSQGGACFIVGAYVGRSGVNRFVADHDEGWTAIVVKGRPPLILDSTSDRRFAGCSGESAFLDWLRP